MALRDLVMLNTMGCNKDGNSNYMRDENGNGNGSGNGNVMVGNQMPVQLSLSDEIASRRPQWDAILASVASASSNTTSIIIYLPHNVYFRDLKHDAFEASTSSGPPESGMVSKWRMKEWDDHRFKQALKVKNPKHMLKNVLDCCKNKTKCEVGDVIDEDQQDGEEEVKKKHHGGCGAQQPKISIDGMKILAEYKVLRKKEDDQEQLMSEAVERKQHLSAETDDLMHQLAMIIRHNENLKKQENNGAPAHIITEFSQLLQFHIATYFDNELHGQPRVTLLSRFIAT